MSVVAPPSALPPAAPTLRHRLRARRAAARPGVTVRGLPLLGRGVRFDLTDGGRVVLEDGCVLQDGCRFHVRGGTVTVGAGAVLGERCAVLCHERIEVGPGALVADETPLIDFRHDHRDPERPVRHQRILTSPLTIKAGARVGPSG